MKQSSKGAFKGQQFTVDVILWTVRKGQVAIATAMKAPHHTNCTIQAALLGGDAQVRLEDSLYIGKGKLAFTNAEQVPESRRIREEAGVEIAKPAEARAMLGLKGGDRVGICGVSS